MKPHNNTWFIVVFDKFFDNINGSDDGRNNPVFMYPTWLLWTVGIITS